MRPTITLDLRRSPSALANLLRAFASFGKKRSHPPPVLEAALPNTAPDFGRIAAFHAICGVPRRALLHPLYPFALCYPLAMRVLASRAMPFSMTRVLNTRNIIVQTRPIALPETLDLGCRSTHWRAAAGGYELDLVFDVTSEDELVWSCTATYLVRGKTAGAALAPAPARLPRLRDPLMVASWRLEPRHRIQFARVSGDSNGIHIWSWYARRFGFERDFAQPLRVVARCVDVMLPPGTADWPCRIEFRLKGPVYYDSTLCLRRERFGDQHRFDLHREGEPRPCIIGQIGPARAALSPRLSGFPVATPVVSCDHTYPERGAARADCFQA